MSLTVIESDFKRLKSVPNLSLWKSYFERTGFLTKFFQSKAIMNFPTSSKRQSAVTMAVELAVTEFVITGTVPTIETMKIKRAKRRLR